MRKPSWSVIVNLTLPETNTILDVRFQGECLLYVKGSDGVHVTSLERFKFIFSVEVIQRPKHDRMMFEKFTGFQK